MRTVYVVVTTGEPDTPDKVFRDEVSAVAWKRQRDEAQALESDRWDPTRFRHIEQRQVRRRWWGGYGVP